MASKPRKPARTTPKPRALSITRPKRERYLELVATGTPLPEAARAIGATGRLMRSLAHNDPEFAQARDKAIAEGKATDAEEYVPTLRAARRKLAVEELDGRMLHYESIAYDPDYRQHFTKTQVEMTGPGGGPVEVVHVEHTPEELARILRRLEQLGLVRPGPVFAALAEGKPVLAALPE